MALDLTTPENFEALVREHQGLVFRTLTRLTGAGAHVEDLAQETFLRLYRALPYFRGDSTLSTYLYRIVVNVAQDEWKRRRRERAHIVATPAFDNDESEPADSGWLENFAGDPRPMSTPAPPSSALPPPNFNGRLTRLCSNCPSSSAP